MMSDLYYIPGATMPDGTAKTYYRPGEPFTLDGVQHAAGWQPPIGGVAEVTVTGTRPDDRWYQVTETFTGPDIAYTSAPKDLATVKALKLADLAAKRYAVEVAGVTVSGLAVATDRDSRVQLKAKIEDVTAARIAAPRRLEGARRGSCKPTLATLQAWDGGGGRPCPGRLCHRSHPCGGHRRPDRCRGGDRLRLQRRVARLMLTELPHMSPAAVERPFS